MLAAADNHSTLMSKMANAQLGVFSLPQIQNETLVQPSLDARLTVQLHYAPNSKERDELQKAILALESQLPIEIPCIVDGKPVDLVLEQTLT